MKDILPDIERYGRQRQATESAKWVFYSALAVVGLFFAIMGVVFVGLLLTNQI